jgi:Berberine and berberine like
MGVRRGGRVDALQVGDDLLDGPVEAVQVQAVVAGPGPLVAGSPVVAFAYRRRRVLVALGAVWEGAQAAATQQAWVAGFAAVLGQGAAGVYVNFLGAEGPARVREAYPGSTWERLAAVKRRYDPTNLFHRNQNIPPAIQGSGR